MRPYSKSLPSHLVAIFLVIPPLLEKRSQEDVALLLDHAIPRQPMEDMLRTNTLHTSQTRDACKGQGRYNRHSRQ